MTLAMATGSVLGGLLPDIDNVHSQIGSRLPVVELIVHGCQRGIRLLSGILPRKLRENVRSMTGHRGLLHSLLVPAAMLLALPVIGNTNGIEKTFLIGSGYAISAPEELWTSCGDWSCTLALVILDYRNYIR